MTKDPVDSETAFPNAVSSFRLGRLYVRLRKLPGADQSLRRHSRGASGTEQCVNPKIDRYMPSAIGPDRTFVVGTANGRFEPILSDAARRTKVGFCCDGQNVSNSN
jgi:hypothetical protein